MVYAFRQFPLQLSTHDRSKFFNVWIVRSDCLKMKCYTQFHFCPHSSMKFSPRLYLVFRYETIDLGVLWSFAVLSIKSWYNCCIDIFILTGMKWTDFASQSISTHIASWFFLDLGKPMTTSHVTSSTSVLVHQGPEAFLLVSCVQTSLVDKLNTLPQSHKYFSSF